MIVAKMIPIIILINIAMTIIHWICWQKSFNCSHNYTALFAYVLFLVDMYFQTAADDLPKGKKVFTFLFLIFIAYLS